MTKSIMIAAAGHVDHGKTSLVKILTGIDTDVLSEEKRRGLTIETGFAHISLKNGIEAGIADVPGHEDFIKNMISACASLDLLLLVIAADDGIMPQTVEHLSIARLFGDVPVIAVISKIDLVSIDRIKELTCTVRSFFDSEKIDEYYILPFSFYAPAGKDAIVNQIEVLSEKIIRKRDCEPFRMNISRVFSRSGAGTIITGFPVSGKVELTSDLEILPKKIKCTVKGIQRFGVNVEAASCGATAALNLRNIKKETVKKGMIVAQRGVFQTAKVILADFVNISGKKLKKSEEFLFFTGTLYLKAKVIFLDRCELHENKRSFAKIFFKEDIVCVPGDRFALRSFNPPLTVGGGVIVKALPSTDRREKTVKVKTVKIDPFCSKILAIIERTKDKGIALGTAAEISGEDKAKVSKAAELLQS